MKRITETQCTMCKNCNYFYAYFQNQFKLFLLPFLRHLQFQYILQLIYQLFFSKFTIFIVQILTNMTWYITYTFIMNPLSHISLSINYLHSHCHLSLFHLCLLLQTLSSSVHLLLHVSCHSICLVLLVVNIRLNTLRLIFLTTHNFAYRILLIMVNENTANYHCILALILEGKKTGSSLLRLTTFGLTLHSWVMIETHFSGNKNFLAIVIWINKDEF